MKPTFAELVLVCREDAARWVQPGELVDVASVTPAIFLRLLARYRSLRATTWLRVGTWLKQRRVRGAATLVQHRLMRLYGLEISPGAEIGGGLYIAHPVGCTITAERIGRNVTFIAGVTVGYRKTARWPVIGDRVYVGAGARILGPIELGDDVKVAANAVVMSDVPVGCTVAGVPARVVRDPRDVRASPHG